MPASHPPSDPPNPPDDGATPADGDVTPAVAAARAAGIDHVVTRHGRVGSLAEAAAARGIAPRDLVKSMVVRIDDEHYLFVLVPGDRQIAWPRLRELLGVSRLSMPDAARAREVTGYERGTITPLGSSTAWPVVADSRIVGRQISVGAGAHGVGLTLAADDLVAHLGARLADISDPE
ncbi:YbaK/prolyl-tRNA synthetase associated region [Actinomycetales bacterium JB111]|nr:YbaK/prolyl-tRNA synthetase associated region [Actinomycetales bacterium JB111]